MKEVRFGKVSDDCGHDHLYMEVAGKVIGYFHIGEEVPKYFGFFNIIDNDVKKIVWTDNHVGPLLELKFNPFK